MPAARSVLLFLVTGVFGCGSGEIYDLAPIAQDAPSLVSADRESTADGSTPANGAAVLSDDDPDRAADPYAAPKDDPTPPETRAELMRTFAPHVHLHPDDPNRPANVDWYLERVTMRFHHSGCPDHELLGPGLVTQATLVAQSHPEAGLLFCTHDSGRIATSTASDRFFLEVTDHTSYAGAPRAEWKTYVVWRPHADDGLVNLEYWLFYPYNDGVSVFNHESDWEHVRVTIDPKADEGRGKAIEVKLSAHHGGTIVNADDSRLEREGTHPVAYVAWGTHANYLAPGSYAIEGTGGIAKDTTKAAPAADVWKTEDSLVAIGTRAAPQNGQVFVKYWGRWGELGDIPESSGVTRHFP
jgi:hypothetical protein